MITRKSTGRLKSYIPSVVTLELTAGKKKDPLSDRITRFKQKKNNPMNSLRKEKIDLLLESIDFTGFFGATIGPTIYKPENSHFKTSYQVYKQEQYSRPKHSNKINQGKRQQSRSLVKQNKSKCFETLTKWPSSKDSFGMSSVLIGSFLNEKQDTPTNTVGQSIQAEAFKKQMKDNIPRNKMSDTPFKISISGNNSSFQGSLSDTITPNLDFTTKRRYVAWKQLNSKDKISKGAIRSWTANHRSIVKY